MAGASDHKVGSAINIIQALPNAVTGQATTLKASFDLVGETVRLKHDSLCTYIDANLASSTGTVLIAGAQTITGVKTFSSNPIVPTPATAMQVATKKYVDDNILASGTADCVHLTGNETIASGVKTFVVSPIVPEPTTDYQVACKKYVDDLFTGGGVVPIGDGIYVAKTGNDSTGTGAEDAPYLTIQKAVGLAVAGNTIYVKAGTYNERVHFESSGTVNALITLTNYRSEVVKIDGTGIGIGSSWGDALCTLVDLNGEDYIKIDGITVQNSNYWGIGSFAGIDAITPDEYGYGSNYITVNNCTITECLSSGIIFHCCTGLVITNNRITHTNSSGDQEMMSIVACDYFDISYNDISNGDKPAGSESIDCKRGCSYGNIHHNYCHDNTSMGVYIDALYDTTNINIYNNTFYNLGSEGIRLANEVNYDEIDYGYINMYGNTNTYVQRGLRVAQAEYGDAMYPIHHFTYNNNTHSNIYDVNILVELTAGYMTSCSFTE